MLTERQYLILTLIARHYTLTAAQFRRLIFLQAQDPDGRLTRRLLSTLHSRKLINKTNCQVVNPLHSLSCPVYYPSRSGCEVIAVRNGSSELLLTPTQTPQWQNLRHWICLSDLRITIDIAIAAQSDVQMPCFFNEFDVVNKDAKEPGEQYRLYTLIATTPRRLCCVPDAGLGLLVQGGMRGFYIELETGSNPPRKSAAEKTPGYQALYEQQLHRRHFPEAGDFRVLCFAPDAPWRDALRKAFREKPGAALWKFAALPDVKPDTFLHAPIFHAVDDRPPTPLVKGESR